MRAVAPALGVALVLGPAIAARAAAEPDAADATVSRSAAPAAHGSTPASRVTVKLAASTGVRVVDGALVSAAGADLGPLPSVIVRFGARPAPLFDLPAARLDAMRARGEARTGMPLPDLNLYFELTVEDGVDAAAFAAALAGLAAVEHVYPSPLPAPPPGDLPPETSDCRPQQGYERPAPDGIDALYAWNYPGGRGEGSFVVDVEYDWIDQHEDLEAAAGQVLVYVPKGLYAEHGTAVLGVLVASDDRWGVTGLVPDLRVGMVTHYPAGDTYSVARAVAAASDLLAAGDVILLEAQTSGPGGAYVPVEWNPAEFDAIALASALGIVVVEAAGNGGKDLDGPEFLGRFDRTVRDSGAIIVGAGARPGGSQPDRSRKDFSCYGTRVDLQGWGESVTTSGYWAACGGIQEDRRQQYLTSFSGTSSASPMVAAAVASVEGIARALGRPPLAPAEVARLLADTGSPQQAGPHPGSIGPRPDLRSAIRVLLASVIYDSHALADPAPGGNGDGAGDPGETIEMSLCLHNAGAGRASGVRARLVDPGAGWVQIVADEAGFGDLEAGATACALGPPFAVVLAPYAPCGGSVHLPIEVESDLGVERVSAVRLVVGSDGECSPAACAEPAPLDRPVLVAAKEGAADLHVEWTAAAGAAGYRVWRRPSAGGADRRPVASPGASESALLLVAELESPDPAAFYDVRAVNACGWEGP